MIQISFSWDDGSPLDKKIFDLHEKYQFPAVLFVPNKNCEGLETLSKADIKAMANSKIITFGGHTRNHVYLTEIPLENVFDEVADNKKYLEDIVQKNVDYFCFPGGKYNKDVFKEISSEFKIFRTAGTMSSNFSKIVRTPTFHFYPRGRKSLLLNSLRNKDKIFFDCLKKIGEKDYFELIKEIISSASKKDKLYQIHIWGHSWEIENLGLWEKLESLFAFLKSNYSESIVGFNGEKAVAN